MSVHPHGDGWQVRWRDHGKQQGRTFARKGDANTADEAIKRRKRLGQELSSLFLDGSTDVTLIEFIDTGFRTHAAIRAQKTREQYRWAIDLHLQELLDEPLGALTVPRLAEHQTFLLENGRTPHTVRTVMTLLGKIMQVAVDHGRVPANAAHALTKVSAEPADEIVPLAPAELEAVIAALEGRWRAVAVLAGHLGLSPIEVRLAPWEDLHDGRLMIGAARTKRQRARARVITVPTATMAELNRWRLQAGRPTSGPIIGPITAGTLKQWSWRSLKPLIADVAGIDASLYTLRHSHASALHYCGYTTPAAARRMGHSPVLHMRHYAHVIDALEGQPRYADLDALIAAARSAGVPTEFPKAEKK